MLRLLVLALAGALLTACGPGDEKALTVFAAASLREPFDAIAAAFEAEHDVDVRLSYAGSSTLATQIREGAPADVFAAAAEEAMTGIQSTAPIFARNEMQIAVPPGNPARVNDLRDLARVDVALCQPAVPCGAAAQQVLERAGIRLTPRTLEPDVKATLAKVQIGEVDAALVYVTDVRAAGTRVAGIAIPPQHNVRTAYPIAALSRNDPAQRFVDFVRSPAGQRILVDAGFLPP